MSQADEEIGGVWWRLTRDDVTGLWTAICDVKALVVHGATPHEVREAAKAALRKAS